ncbi:MAG: 2-C-methyl-D-erythritol 2,4-cyclodiphosphate synthase [Armatimonadota bacterium]
MRACALIPAAGRGERFGRGSNKVFADIAGKPILAHTLSVFESCDAIGEIIIVTGEREIEAVGELVDRFGFTKVRHIVAGGDQRQDSVRRGLEMVTSDIVAIHDAARPMVTCEIIERSIEEARRSGACIAAVPVIDTIKSTLSQPSPSQGEGVKFPLLKKEGVRGRLLVSGTVDRANLYSVQTPQTFRTELVRWAYEQAFADGFYATDDAALVERMGESVAIVQGSYDNIKITTPSDVELASMKLLRDHLPGDDRLSSETGPVSQSKQVGSPHWGLGGGEQRSGLGFDVHALVQGRKLILGGVDVPYEKGLMGHSDADVLVHAIMDALLGAAALGDIGVHFPDSDPVYRGISSMKLLSHVGELLDQNGWRVTNIDAVVICERPKIAAHVPEMVRGIAKCLCTEPNRISIKGTTTEKLGFTGRGEGIACQAIATLYKP